MDRTMYTIYVCWNNGCKDRIQINSNTLTNIIVNSLLVQQDFTDLYVKDTNENCIYFILNGKYTANALNGYWKIPLED